MKISGRLEKLLKEVDKNPGLSIQELVDATISYALGDNPCRCGNCLECLSTKEYNCGFLSAVEFGWLVVSSNGKVYRTNKK